jgi:hypothetical protein
LELERNKLLTPMIDEVLIISKTYMHGTLFMLSALIHVREELLRVSKLMIMRLGTGWLEMLGEERTCKFMNIMLWIRTEKTGILDAKTD